MERAPCREVDPAIEQGREVIPQIHERDKSEALIIHISEQVDVRGVLGGVARGRAVEVKRGHALGADRVGMGAQLSMTKSRRMADISTARPPEAGQVAPGCGPSGTSGCNQVP